MSPVEESDLVMTTLDDGSVVASGETIPLSVTLFAGTYEGKNLSIDLQNLDGTSLTKVEVDDLGEISPVALPEGLTPGPYRLHFQVMEDDQVVAERFLQFFHTDTMPRISGISSYPLVLQPGAQGLMELRIPPLEADPWVRWSLEGQILTEGLLSEISSRLAVSAPVTVGAYTVRADFYPFAPPAGSSWDFSSPVYQETLLYVSEEIKVDDPHFQNPGVFSTLFHFQGEYADWSGEEPELVLTVREEPVLDVYRGVFGYRMDLFSGFTGDYFPFPVTAEGRLEPFSLVFSLAVADNLRGGAIFRAENETGDFSLAFELDDEGFLLVNAGLGGGETLALRSVERGEPGAYPPITVSVVPDYREDKIYFLLYRGGSLLASGEKNWAREDFSAQGSFSLGGEEGAPVILDEFGVYFRDLLGRSSPSAGMFQLDQLEEYGHRLILADGFDSPHLLPGAEITGDYHLRFSRLELSPGGLFLSPPLTGDLQSFTGFAFLEPGSDPKDALVVQLWGTKEDGSVLLAESTQEMGSSVEWDCTVTEEGLVFNHVMVPREALETVSAFRIGLATSGATSLFLKDVTFLKENLRLTGQTETSREVLSSAEDEQTDILPENPA